MPTLLEKLDYVQEINACIDETLKLVETHNDADKWEELKLEMINKSKTISKSKAKERSRIIKELEGKIVKLENLEQENNNELQEMKSKIRNIYCR